MYDQGHVVFRPARMEPDTLRLGLDSAYKGFYSAGSIASRFPFAGKRSRAQWAVYNLFMRKASRTEKIDSIAPATPEPELAPRPPILPIKREWRDAVLEALEPETAARQSAE